MNDQTTQTVHQGWRMDAEWVLHRGRLEPVTISFTAVNGDDVRPVSGTTIRNLPIGKMIAEARIGCSRREGLSDERRESLTKFAGVGPRRGAALTPEQVQAVADVYYQAWEAGDSVTNAVAEHFGVGQSAATKRISKARAAGLLDGFKLTPIQSALKAQLLRDAPTVKLRPEAQTL